MLHTANSKGKQEEVLLLTEPQRIENKDLILPIAEHDYKTGKADWVLTDAEQMAMVLNIKGTGTQGANAIAEPIAGKVFIVINGSAQAIKVKAANKTGITVATLKSAILMGNGTDFVRLTDDA